MAVKRNRRKQTVSFDERLQKAAQQAREAARNLPLGPQRESMLRKAEQARLRPASANGCRPRYCIRQSDFLI